MARIKKTGLDYFPIDTHFLNNRNVRRLMKREGDAALAVLMHVYCAIYSGKGYYVEATDVFFEDVADCLFTLDVADVRRVVALALEFGLFHEGLYRDCGILTSESIQQQFVFSARRRQSVCIDGRYNLLPPPEEASAAPAPPAAGEAAQPPFASPQPAGAQGGTGAEIPKMCTETAENAAETSRGTHSIAQQSTAQQSIAHPLPQAGSPETGCPGEETPPAAAVGGGTTSVIQAPPLHGSRGGRLYTQADVDAMMPPADGLPRNLDGLRHSLRQWRVPPAEQYAIVLKTNFGVIGHPLWRGFYTLRSSHGKIRQPGRYLLSLCVGRRGEAE